MIRLSIVSAVSLLYLQSCSNKFENDVFDGSASERIEQSITEYHKLLASSTNGWILEYYPGGKKREAQGHTYALKFSDTHVTAMLDIAAETASATTYSIKPNGGVTLSFDEYNPLLHHFVAPSGGAYNGQLADFEFVIMSHTDDVVVLKGKKYHSLMRLVKLQESADSYMEKVRDVRNYVTGKGLSEFLIDGQEISFRQPKNIVFTYQENQENRNISTTYLYTDRGMKFYEPLTINGTTFQELILNIDTNSLHSADGKVIFKLLYDIPFNFSATEWWSVEANKSSSTSDRFSEVFNKVKEVNDKRYSNLNVSLSNFIYFRSSTEEIRLFSDIKGTDSGYPAFYKLAFRGGKKPDEVNISLVGEGQNWNFFTHLNPLRDLIVKSSPYKVELNDTANPTTVKLTSIQNPEVWFVLAND